MAGTAGWKNVKFKAVAMGTVGIVSGATRP
jgi:hypothetical protein